MILSNIILVLRMVQNLGRTVCEVPSKSLLRLCPLLDIGFAAYLSLCALEVIISLLSLRLCWLLNIYAQQKTMKKINEKLIQAFIYWYEKC
jgi:hypothetical protein